ncbi:MAG: hypothetical protein N3F07_02270 [Candidatus Micrarchaeota archaeon]|nr:hypothetical protein [Candidatus Micrarchaeota archaeon]
MLFAGILNLDMRLKIAISFILLTFMLVLAGVDRDISLRLFEFGDYGALLAGVFYTLGITTPLSMVVILELMKLNSPFASAFLAALSAATANLLLFLAVRKSLEKNARGILESIDRKFSRAKAAYPIVGFFVFGLPLPDELGLALMGMTTIEPLKLWLAVFLAKFFTLILFWKSLS